MITQLAVNELYPNLTIQGEGPSLGRLCTFVRLARCNLDCGEGAGATWCCDSAFTWRWNGGYPAGERPTFSPLDEVHMMDVGQVVDHVLALAPPLLVISGGEPLLQRTALTQLVRDVACHGIEVEIETNGTQRPWGDLTDWTSAFNVSPKLANSGVGRDRAWKLDALTELRDTGKARFKFVCSDPADLDEVDQLTQRAGIPSGMVWVMPAGTDRLVIRQSLERVAEQAIARGWNVTTRLHVDLWGNRRGV